MRKLKKAREFESTTFDTGITFETDGKDVELRDERRALRNQKVL
jgi:hypothetical protein